MKKIIRNGLALLLVGCTVFFTSCNKEEEIQPIKKSAEKVETADVVVAVEGTKGEAENSATAKNVKRGTVYAWVKDIDVTATSNVWNYSKSEHYDLVSNATPGADNNFIFEDAAVGANTFVASTSSYSTNKVHNLGLIPLITPALPAAAASSFIATAKAHHPYATYSATTTANIANATANVVNFNMTTQHGRIISAFRISDDLILKANVYATVTAAAEGEAVQTSTQFVNSVVTFEWSNEKSLAGKKVVYTVKVYDNTSPNLLLKTYTITNTVEASTSKSCIYIIDRDQILNSEEDNLTFSWQVWNEQSDCDDCD